jgi:cobalt-zinc-cadmium resistance protein CzcA
MIGRWGQRAAETPRLVMAVLLVAVVAAAFVARDLKLDALPDVTPNQVVILTTAPGLTPEEVERLVTRPIEVAIGAAPGLAAQRSLSRYGVSSVIAEFDDALPHHLARQVVQERVGSLALPAGVDPPALGPPTGGLGEVFHFSLRSPVRSRAELLELAELRVRPLLSRVPGVVEVNTWGGAVRAFDVVADPAALAARGLTLDDLERSLVSAQGTAAGATLRTADGQAYLRAARRPQGPEALADVVVDASGERPVRVNDVAHTEESFPPRLGAATADGEGEIVYVMVQMLRGANALELTAALNDRMPLVKQALPEDVRVEVIYDRQNMVWATLRTVGRNLLEGGLLVILVLFVMLGSLRAGLLVAAIIPLSMVFALAGMVLFDIPGNLMSLGAIDFGLLVDGGVVVIETVFHVRRPPGGHVPQEPMAMTVKGVLGQVGKPVFSGMLIILLAYLPILLLTGVDGKLFRPMASTVVMALIAALVLSLLVLPAATALLLRDRHVPERPTLPVRLLQRSLDWMLAALLPRRGLLAVGAGLIAAGGLILALSMGTAFVPQLDEGDLVVQTTRRPDITLPQAVVEAGALERAFLEDIPEVLHVVSRIGSPAVATDMMGLEQADVFVRLKPREQWREGLRKEAIIEQMQTALERRGLGGDPAFTQPIQMRFNEMLGGEVSDVTLSVFGDDLAALQAFGKRAQAALEQVPGATDVRLSTPPDAPMTEVLPSPERAARVGLSVEDVLHAVTMVRTGVEVGVTQVGPANIPVRLRVAGDADPFSLGALRLPADGRLVRLADVADVQLRTTPSLVSHDEGQRRLVVGFNIRDADLGDVMVAAQAAVNALPLERGLWLAWGGQAESLERAKRRIGWLIPLVLALIFTVLVLTLKKVRSALIVLSHVPFASVGGIVALSLRGMPVSISAAVGFIALSGIAILNGVVLMSEILSQQAAGADPSTAAARAAAIRARPVMMTALVAALGFVPMMISDGVGAEVQRPLATVIVGGLTTSTLLTLLILPGLYPLFAGPRVVDDDD